ncbi:GNAT family N-acetyltransferase [Burkholderia stagnalis]
MHGSFIIRAAAPSDAAQLSKLAILSKSHWGDPKDWLDLWRADLTITPEMLESSMGCVAEADGAIIGFWVREAVESERPTPGWLFVHPDHMGRGIARALRKEAAARGIRYFVIEADPHAMPFYLALGAKKIGEKESAVIPGRFFPILRITI